MFIGMRKSQIILGVLLLVPLGLLIANFLRPGVPGDRHDLLEMFFLLLGLPILILNLWGWLAPEQLEDLFKVTWSTPGPAEAVSGRLAWPGLPPFLAQLAWPARAGLLAGGLLLILALSLLLNRVDPAARPAPTVTGGVNATPKGEETVIAGGETPTAMGEIPLIEATPTLAVLPAATEPALVLEPTLTATATSSGLVQVTTATPTAAQTQFVGLCAPAGEQQLLLINTGIQSINPNYATNDAWVVKSDELEGVWFVAARMYDTVSGQPLPLPGLWAFLGSLEVPELVFSVNDTALQFSFYGDSQSNDPPITINVAGALDAYDCAMANSPTP